MKTPKFTTKDLLMGIEWEPQFTLLNYPKAKIAFINSPRLNSDPRGQGYTSDDWDDFISIFTDRIDSYHQMKFMGKEYKNMYCDGYNVEVYTNPTPLSDIKTEVLKAGETLKQFTNDLALKHGPAGVFLPMTRVEVTDGDTDENYMASFLTPSKHVNFSLPYYNDNVGKRQPLPFTIFVQNQPVFKEIVFDNSLEPDGIRLHLNVSYDFNDYEKLAELVIEYANQGLFEYAYEKRTHETFREIKVLTHNLQVELVNLYSQKKMKKPLFLGYVRNNGFIQIEELI